VAKLCKKCGETKELSEFRFINAKQNYSSPCKLCRYTKSAEWVHRNPDKVRQNRRRLAPRYAEKANARTRLWAANNPDKLRTAKRLYNYKNRDKIRAYKKAWKTRNPDLRNALRMHYLARKLQATPKWLTKEQRFRINFFYTLCKYLTWVTGIPFQVDHIVPLKGKDICGLHVPWNLRPLPATLNNLKGNRLEEL
jgi:hypothetical protein